MERSASVQICSFHTGGISQKKFDSWNIIVPGSVLPSYLTTKGMNVFTWRGVHSSLSLRLADLLLSRGSVCSKIDWTTPSSPARQAACRGSENEKEVTEKTSFTFLFPFLFEYNKSSFLLLSVFSYHVRMKRKGSRYLIAVAPQVVEEEGYFGKKEDQ